MGKSFKGKYIIKKEGENSDFQPPFKPFYAQIGLLIAQTHQGIETLSMPWWVFRELSRKTPWPLNLRQVLER